MVCRAWPCAFLGFPELAARCDRYFPLDRLCLICGGDRFRERGRSLLKREGPSPFSDQHRSGDASIMTKQQQEPGKTNRVGVRDSASASSRYAAVSGDGRLRGRGFVHGGCVATGPLEYMHNGFKVGPNYGGPPAPVADEWIEAKNANVQNRQLQDWWSVFQDPTLNSLINTAYDQNLNLRISARGSSRPGPASDRGGRFLSSDRASNGAI